MKTKFKIATTISAFAGAGIVAGIVLPVFANQQQNTNNQTVSAEDNFIPLTVDQAFDNYFIINDETSLFSNNNLNDSSKVTKLTKNQASTIKEIMNQVKADADNSIEAIDSEYFYELFQKFQPGISLEEIEQKMASANEYVDSLITQEDVIGSQNIESFKSSSVPTSYDASKYKKALEAFVDMKSKLIVSVSIAWASVAAFWAAAWFFGLSIPAAIATTAFAIAATSALAVIATMEQDFKDNINYLILSSTNLSSHFEIKVESPTLKKTAEIILQLNQDVDILLNIMRLLGISVGVASTFNTWLFIIGTTLYLIALVLEEAKI